MEKLQKGFIKFPAILAIILGAVVLGGAYIITHQNNISQICVDGQGSAIYIPKNTLLKNLKSTSELEIQKFYISPIISADYIAQILSNSCGEVKNRIIDKNGEKKDVSQKDFDKFLNDYNNSCKNCLFQLSQHGNSPLFVKEYSSGQSYDIKNNKGILVLEPAKTN